MSEARREFDVHRMRELERRAEMWERQYRLLLDSLPDAVFTEDERGNLIATNAAGERLSGFPRPELLRMKIRELLPELPALPESGGHFTAAVELRAHDGSRRPVTLHASLVNEPGWPVVVQYVARESAVGTGSEEAGHAETRFRLMTKNLTEMVLAYDMDRRLTFANSAAESLTGYSVADLERQEFICWVHPED